jgi:hypothetical protein
MPKPVAYVFWSVGSMGGSVTIETVPDTDADGTHCAQAVAAAVIASSGWGAVRPVSTHSARVSMGKPKDRNIGGGALRDAVKYVTQDARDAAKACLRGFGYTVRS